MRIQHNIMAMNSYRNYTSNTSALAKNLEKLSSGYKINRAGDDAAGLAISEKMRAQITGLSQAQANAKSGINLVQTAEGALTEVHDMLNRMVKLADQSANGTYDNDVDRANLQKEISQLKSEIDRIADASNFNGIKLLDGTLSTQGVTKTATTEIDTSNLSRALTATVTDVDAVKGVYGNTTAVADITSTTLGDNEGTAISYTFEYTDADGNAQSKTVELTFKSSGNADKGGKLIAADGTEYAAAADATGVKDKIEKASIEAAVLAELQKDDGIKSNFDVSASSDKFVFTAKTAGTEGAVLTGVKASKTTAAGLTTNTADAATTTTKATDAFQAIDLGSAVLYDGSTTGANTLDKAAFEINGEKFVFVANGKVTDDTLAAMKEAGISHYVEAAGASIDEDDVASMVEKIKMATGLDVDQGETSVTNGVTKWTSDNGTPANTKIALKPSTSTSTKATGGLTLQIGDTSDDFNKLTVSVQDMHTKALGIGSIDISTQDGASKAVDVIKTAINTVSSVRGDLGATQNRLEHTMNNLSVMQENIQDAEATIRDVDVADEMMAYTKNNILVQSAQAMLAQANQVPQGVLQLLQ